MRVLVLVFRLLGVAQPQPPPVGVYGMTMGVLKKYKNGEIFERKNIRTYIFVIVSEQRAKMYSECIWHKEHTFMFHFFHHSFPSIVLVMSCPFQETTPTH